MPEMTFSVRWPDGRAESYYSPSLVIHDHLAEGRAYTVTEFTSRSLAGLAEASERVRAIRGFACTSAAMTSSQITGAADRYGADELVRVLSLHPPLPVPGGST